MYVFFFVGVLIIIIRRATTFASHPARWTTDDGYAIRNVVTGVRLQVPPSSRVNPSVHAKRLCTRPFYNAHNADNRISFVESTIFRRPFDDPTTKEYKPLIAGTRCSQHLENRTQYDSTLLRERVKRVRVHTHITRNRTFT